MQAVQADDEQVDVDAALDRGDRGSLITARPGVMIRLCCIWQASQQLSASSRIISARCVTPVSCQSLISRLKVTMRQVWTVGSAGAGALSPSTDACGIAGGASVIAILKKTVAGRLTERGSQARPRRAGGAPVSGESLTWNTKFRSRGPSHGHPLPFWIEKNSCGTEDGASATARGTRQVTTARVPPPAASARTMRSVAGTAVISTRCRA